MRKLFVSILGLALLPGCTTKVRHEDNVNLPALRAAFHCPGRSTDEEHACRILADFGSGQRFEAAPQTNEIWYGRKVCANSRLMNFAKVVLRAGRGELIPKRDLPPDPRDLPYAASFGGNTFFQAESRPDYEALLSAAKTGTPAFDHIPDRWLVDGAWQNAKKLDAGMHYHLLTRSDGPSILGEPFTDGSKDFPSSHYVIRSSDRRMLLVQPWPGDGPCVSELWKIASDVK